ncbi:hypothetical protein [Nevskia sp.]|uniref:hypothetical protein n=1 Tax=Nevskia sp. TaxID=1929292 RepID=UPI0025F120BE|nr:hypothetical protein [Nevskia sp.]
MKAMTAATPLSTLAAAARFACPVAIGATPGARIGPEIYVAEAERSDRPDIARDSAGGFVVTWRAIEGEVNPFFTEQNRYTVFARLYSSDGVAAGPAFRVAGR